MIIRILKIVGIIALVLAIVAGVLYSYGGMWIRTPEMVAAYDNLVANGQAQKFESRFVIPIPGCTCHHDDPVVQAAHSNFRIRDCFDGCH